MDIKNSKQKYALTCGLDHMDLSAVEQSINFLMSGKVPFEFRTTVVKDFHASDDFEDIANWLGNPPKYFLQQFVIHKIQNINYYLLLYANIQIIFYKNKKPWIIFHGLLLLLNQFC